MTNLYLRDELIVVDQPVRRTRHPPVGKRSALRPFGKLVNERGEARLFRQRAEFLSAALGRELLHRLSDGSFESNVGLYEPRGHLSILPRNAARRSAVMRSCETKVRTSTSPGRARPRSMPRPRRGGKRCSRFRRARPWLWRPPTRTTARG